MISFAFAFFLDWWFAGTATSFLLVFVIYLLVAALLVYLGVRKIKQIKAPEQTIESVRETTAGPEARLTLAVPARAALDQPDIELPGPWSHRYVSANGARFHVCESLPEPTPRSAPLVVLLHGFPEFWWAWRHQLPVLAAAGYRAVAMDLRGYGASDKTPRGYDPLTLAADVGGRHPRAGGPQRRRRRPRLGRVRRMDRRRPAPRVRGRPLRRGGAASVGADPDLRPVAAADDPRSARAGDAGARGCRSGASPRAAYVAQHLAAWSAPGERLPLGGGGPTATAPPSRSGPRRTARWSTTAGCSGRGCAPTAGPSPGC